MLHCGEMPGEQAASNCGRPPLSWLPQAAPCQESSFCASTPPQKSMAPSHGSGQRSHMNVFSDMPSDPPMLWRGPPCPSSGACPISPCRTPLDDCTNVMRQDASSTEHGRSRKHSFGMSPSSPDGNYNCTHFFELSPKVHTISPTRRPVQQSPMPRWWVPGCGEASMQDPVTVWAGPGAPPQVGSGLVGPGPGAPPRAPRAPPVGWGPPVQPGGIPNMPFEGIQQVPAIERPRSLVDSEWHSDLCFRSVVPPGFSASDKGRGDCCAWARKPDEPLRPRGDASDTPNFTWVLEPQRKLPRGRSCDRDCDMDNVGDCLWPITEAEDTDSIGR